MLNISDLHWDDARKQNLHAGTSIDKANLLFAKIEDETIEKQILKLKS